MTVHFFSFPTSIYFGVGAKDKLNEVLKSQKLKHPLFVTDTQVAKLDFFQKLKQKTKEQKCEPDEFSDFSGNPVKSHVDQGVKQFKKHKADSIVVIGGGAALDVAKAIALMATHPGDLFDYEDGKPDALPVKNPIPYIVAVPTTAGTGSEVGRSSVVSDDKTKQKKIIFSPALLAKVVLADPTLTLDLPKLVTASTGMDALTHCVESYLAKGFHPMCDGIALEGLRLISKSLTTAVKDGQNIEARASMLMASMMGAVAFQKGLGVTHSCAHALSTVFDLHHGTANSLMISACMRFNLDAAKERFKTMAEVVGINAKHPESFVDWLEQLKKDIGMPMSLKDVKVVPNKQLYDVAFNDVCHPCNPRQVTKDDFVKIFADAG